MNYFNLEKTYSICVKECPNRKLSNMADVYRYYINRSTALCNYNIQPNEYLKQPNNSLSFFTNFGPCPAFEVPEQ